MESYPLKATTKLLAVTPAQIGLPLLVFWLSSRGNLLLPLPLRCRCLRRCLCHCRCSCLCRCLCRSACHPRRGSAPVLALAVVVVFAVAVDVVFAVAFAVLACHPQRGSASVVACSLGCHPIGTCFCRCRSFSKPNPVISTGAAHSLIVSRVAEKPASLPTPLPSQASAFALVLACRLSPTKERHLIVCCGAKRARISPMRQRDEKRRITKSKQTTYKFTPQKTPANRSVKPQTTKSPRQSRRFASPNNYPQPAILVIEIKESPGQPRGFAVPIVSNRCSR